MTESVRGVPDGLCTELSLRRKEAVVSAQTTPNVDQGRAGDEHVPRRVELG